MAQSTLASVPEYVDKKATGLDWLGNIPIHWECLPNRALFQEIKSQGHVDEEMLSVTIGRGVIRQAELLAESSKKDSSNLDKSKYKLVEPGDIAYNKMRAWQGAIGVSAYSGIVSPAYIVERLRGEGDSRYFHHLFRTPAFATEAERWSYGITSDQWSLRAEHFRSIYSSVPPLEEQRLIVRYIEDVDQAVLRFISAKRRLITLLGEQRQILSTGVITGGLESVDMVAAGLPWLESVPRHWRRFRLKHLASVQTGLTLGKDYGSRPLQNFPYLRVANVQTGRLDLSNIKTVDVSAEDARGCLLQTGDVLMTEGGDIDKLGRGAIWHGEIDGCLHQNHLFAVRCHDQLDPEYLVALMGSRHGRAYFEYTAKKTTNLASTNSTTLKEFPIFLPSLAEQRRLLGHVSKAVEPLDAAVDKAQREISLIREFRSRLVSNVVTGKLDVRQVALRLPAQDHGMWDSLEREVAAVAEPEESEFGEVEGEDATT